jgi:hypothetical protein
MILKQDIASPVVAELGLDPQTLKPSSISANIFFRTIASCSDVQE